MVRQNCFAKKGRRQALWDLSYTQSTPYITLSELKLLPSFAAHLLIGVPHLLSVLDAAVHFALGFVRRNSLTLFLLVFVAWITLLLLCFRKFPILISQFKDFV